MSIDHYISDVSCYNWNNGLIDITVTGGVFPYSYKWSDSSVSEDKINLISGDCIVEVTDSHGCTIIDTFTIVQPDKLMHSHTQKNVSCHGGNDGLIDLTIIGGSKPYNVFWSKSLSTEDIYNLTAGSYALTIIDSNLCEIIDTIIITEPLQLAMNHTVNNVSCFNGSNGSVNISDKHLLSLQESPGAKRRFPRATLNPRRSDGVLAVERELDQRPFQLYYTDPNPVTQHFTASRV